MSETARGFQRDSTSINAAINSGGTGSTPRAILGGLSQPGRTTKETHIYRSDDAGEHWTQITTDARPAVRIGGGDLAVPKVDPKNPDVVYTTSIVTWRSNDGGKTWTGIRGAPGGDDYQKSGLTPTIPTQFCW